jgi:2-iminobutanoate/2-iminopropanoate deaminase
MRASLQSINMTLAAGIGWLAAAGAVFAADEPSMHFYNSPAAAAAKVPFSQAVRVGDVVYLSGALGNVPGTRELAAGGIEAETKQTMENIGTVLKANALSFDDVFKCTAMLADMAKWGDFNKVYVTYFQARPLAGAIRVRRERTGAWRAGGARVLGVCRQEMSGRCYCAQISIMP